MAKLQLQGLNKVYPNGVQAVYDFNLDVGDGEFIVLVGPSGCGKTTTLRMVAGLEEISSGKLLIDGKDMTDAPPKSRGIGMVFQNYALYGHLTVYQNMAFSLTLRGIDPDEIHERVLSAAKILGLMTQLNKLPKHLSGGQRQRVAVGRTIVRNPEVFLFDEPLSNLDAKLRGEMRRELKLLHQRFNSTMIYVTHDQIEALTLADRIVCMSMGRVRQVGTPLELYRNPADLFVASFIGLPPMNFFDALVEDGGVLRTDGFCVKPDGGRVGALKDYTGKTVVLGVRPEDACLGGDIPFVLRNVENLGQNTLVHGILNGHKAIFKLSGWLNNKVGEQVKLGFNPDNIHIFDKETTLAII